MVVNPATCDVSPARAWSSARRLLCVRLDGMGDLLMTTPALRALKRRHPHMHLTVLTSPAGAHAARLMPDVDEVLEFEAPWVKANDAADHGQSLALIDQLRRLNFDGAILFTVYSQSCLPAALTCWLAGIPLRLGYCRENPYQLLSHWQREQEPLPVLRHEVQRQLDLVASIGAHACGEHLCLQPEAHHEQWAVRWLREAGLSGPRRRWIVLHPGATAPSRRYPLELWQELVRRLVLEPEMRIVLAGEAADHDDLQVLQRTAPDRCLRVPANLELGQLTALIGQAPVLVCNNSGPAHIAAAMSTPVVVLYALTNPQHTPWRVPCQVLYQSVDCSYCYRSQCPQQHHRCLRGVEPQRVADAIFQLLAGQHMPAVRLPDVRPPVFSSSAQGSVACGVCVS